MKKLDTIIILIALSFITIAILFLIIELPFLENILLPFITIFSFSILIYDRFKKKR